MTEALSADAQRIRRAREVLHWPRSVVARHLGVKPYAIFMYERGDRSVPEGLVDWLEKIARAQKIALRAHPPPSGVRERRLGRPKQERIEAEGAAVGALGTLKLG